MEDKNKLPKLYLNYAKSLPEEILQIRKNWQGFLEHFHQKQLQAVYFQVYRLTKVSLAFNYNELGNKAYELKNYLKSLLLKKELSNDSTQRVTELVESLHQPLEHLPLQKLFLSGSEIKTITTNSICILENDPTLVRELCENLKREDYSSHITSDFNELITSINQFQPSMLLINSSYLTFENRQRLVRVIEEKKELIQLFCIVPNEEVLPKLLAIQAGCSVFFQKPVNIYYLIHMIKEKSDFTLEASLHVLIIEDSPILGEYYAFCLNKNGFETELVSNPLEVISKLELFHPDLIIMDFHTSECTNFDLAILLKQEAKYAKLPIIFLSLDQEISQPLINFNPDGDFVITKSVSPNYLMSVIRTRFQGVNLINYGAFTDNLTGLLNHSSFLKHLELELAYAKHKKIPMSLIMIDIDHLNKINEKYSYEFGDSVIKKLASILAVRLRSQDIIGRFGGEEFAILLAGTTAEQSKKIMDSLREQFSKQHFYNAPNFYATFSAGIIQIEPSSNFHILIKDVEGALYKAKHRGRNQVVINN